MALCWEELPCLLSGSHSCGSPVAPAGSLPEINGNMNGKALEIPSIDSQKAQLKYTIDTFVFVVQVCIYRGVYL